MAEKKFFNIVETGAGRASLMLYGEIGGHEGVSAEAVNSELLALQQAYSDIDVHINSQGGEVFAGIIALCGKPLHMSRYSRLMLHQVSGGCAGGAKQMRECADLIEGLETTLADSTLYAYPACLPGDARTPQADCGPLAAYRFCAAPRDIPLRVVNTAPRRWTVTLPAGTTAGLKDVRLQIDYTGDIGMLFLGNDMISDNFCNGDTWEVGLREYLPQAGALTLTLVIVPLRQGRRINADSPMAARSEQAEAAVAALSEVRVQPVYEILICRGEGLGIRRSRAPRYPEE